MDEISVTEDFSVTDSDGKNYKTKHYNLDSIITLSWSINSCTTLLYEYHLNNFQHS